MVEGEDEATDALPWLFRAITRRVSAVFGRWLGDRFADLLIFSIAGGLLAWSFGMMGQTFGAPIKTLWGWAEDAGVLPVIGAVLIVIVTLLIVFIPLVLLVDTLKRRVVLRGTERDLDRILERQDITDEARAELEEARRNVRTGQPVSYLRPYKQMWQWLRARLRRKQGD